MGAEGAVNILYKASRDREEKIAEYKDKFANPYIAAARGYVVANIASPSCPLR